MCRPCRTISQAVVAFVLLAFLPTPATSQSVSGSITGVVADPSGAVIPGATVTATSVKTGLPHRAAADASGVYTIPLLQPDIYNVRAEQTGFSSTVQENVKVEVNQVVTVNFAMNVGTVQQTVTVEASSTPLLTTAQSDTSHVLEEVQIQNLPLQDRDVFTFVYLMPGVAQVGPVKVGAVGNRNFFDSVFTVNGGRASMNEVLLDGVPDTIGDFNGIAIVPPLGSVQEFKLQAGNYSAEFGRSGGGIVNLVTRSGGNKIHGELYEYLQNSSLNASSWSANRTGQKKVVNQRNHFGGDVGGPVILPHLYNGKDRTFFFFDYEGRRQGDPFSVLTAVPTEAERRGDFSQLVGPRGPITIYNPFTSTPIPGMPGQVTRTAFAGNVIAQNLIDPVAANILKFWPQPNRTGEISGSNNYGFNGKTRLRKDLFDARIDHTISSRNHLFGRFAYERRESIEDNALGTVASSARRIIDSFRNFVLGDTFSITPSLINDLRLGYTRAHANQLPFSTGFDPTTLGFPSYIRDRSNLLVFPDINVSSNPSMAGLGARGFNNQPRDTSSIFESVVKVHGSHTLKTGFSWELIRFMPFQIFSSVGTYSFGGSFTRGPNPTVSGVDLTSGSGFADFLLGAYSGAPPGATYQFQSPLTISHHYYAAYFQDDRKLTRKLTLNLGLRWELETGTQENHDRLTYFDFNAPSPLLSNSKAAAAFPNLRGLLSFTGGGNPRPEWDANKHNFGPRIGAAYVINDKTVLRGGYGIFYLPLSLEAVGALGVNRNITSSQPDRFTPSIFLANPFPGGLPGPIGNSQGSLTQIGQSIQAIIRNPFAPYNQQWDLAVQRALPGDFVVEAAYVGSHGVHLPMQGLQVNQLPPSAQALGTALNQQIPNPFFGVITDPNSILSKDKVTRFQLSHPFPQYQSVNYFRPNLGSSNYQSLQLSLRKRFSHGLSFQGSYTVSKLLDLGGGGNGAAFWDPTPVQNVYNLSAEKSLSNQDIPQRFVASFVYQIPYGRPGQRGADARRVLRGIFGFWQIGGIATWQSGTPFGVQATNDISHDVGQATERADVKPGVDPTIPLWWARSNVRQGLPWFNRDAFAIPREFTFGNSSRTLGALRTDTPKNLDFSLTKSFVLSEKGMRVSFQAEFFNLFNQTVFSAPVTNVNDVNFGRVFGQVNSPRLIQFSLKLVF